MTQGIGLVGFLPQEKKNHAQTAAAFVRRYKAVWFKMVTALTLEGGHKHKQTHLALAPCQPTVLPIHRNDSTIKSSKVSSLP